MSKPVIGVNPVIELLKSDPSIIEEVWIHKKSLSGKKHRILELAKKHGVKVKLISGENFNPPKVAKGVNTQGVVAYISEFPYADLEDIIKNWENKGEIPLVLFLDELEDPRNIGAIIRTADAVGVHGVVIPKLRSCDITETVIKASSGAVFNLPIAKVTNLGKAIEFFKENGLWILGLTHKTEHTIYSVDCKLPLGIVVGNEGRGIRKGILKKCDFVAKLPMIGKVESLNVSVATGVALYEVLRQRFFS
ncbi:MAG: 23S rRNA (guanosine(2251)-2'-O)-methyltransferase RlmB [Thermodesulfobacteria bacterium]|nr:23S rRNA (guanosine(2251)-2'-O)-methyltransferase RlmB [Thermodesulfobacteriota bacterium]